jgi:hypothetical protein
LQRPLTSVHRDEISGIPVFWADSPGPYVGSLLFRVGRIDERLHTSGITHLVEHLALPAAAPTPGLDWNGWVTLTMTGFWAAGEKDDVSRFLSDVANRLQNLPLERLETEKGILRAEEASAGRSVPAVLAGLRFGAVGIALIDWLELGLRRLDAESVSAWARERFTTGNAALWFSGAPPTDLSLSLPDGPRIPPPRYEPPPDDLPAYVRWGRGGAALSLFAPRSYPLALAWMAAEQRAIRRLRYERGLIYSLSATNNPPNRDDANIVFLAECTDANVDAMRKGLLEVLDEIAADGPSDEERAQWLLGLETAAADPNSASSMAASYAEDELFDDFETNEEALEKMRAVTSAEAAAALREAMKSALLAIPEEGAEAPPPPFKEFAAAQPTMQIEGRRFPLKGLKGRLGREGYAILGEDAVSWQGTDGKQLGIAFDECEALMTWEDGNVQLVEANGSWFTLDTNTLRGGDELKAAILRAVPEDRVIPMD